MRLFLKLLFSAFAVVAAIFGLSFLLPDYLQLEQTVVLNATPEQVYTLLNNPTEWERWSPVNKTVDPSMIRLYSGPMSGAGAKMQWSGDKVGNGQVELTESIAPGKVAYKEKEAGSAVTVEGEFMLTRVEEGTAVSWTQKAKLEDKPVARLMGYWMKIKKEKELELGVERLKATLDNSSTKKAAKRKVALSR